MATKLNKEASIGFRIDSDSGHDRITVHGIEEVFLIYLTEELWKNDDKGFMGTLERAAETPGLDHAGNDLPGEGSAYCLA